ncbi:MAG: hypothetical protein IT178_02165 [Acidobacteria bacterium]|nr:hypothetical protein [Acidobacteriota bacterium]
MADSNAGVTPPLRCTYPAFSSITFTDAARTRALVPVTVGYSGATAVLEKRDGRWIVTALVNQWIT